MTGDTGIHRIVVFAPNWLGDAVLALPAVADLRRHFSEAVLSVAARAPLAPLFGAVDGVSGILPLAPAGGLWGAMRRAHDAGRLREQRFDLAVLLPSSFSSAWLARQAGIPERWGYRSDLRAQLLTRPVRRPKGRRHQAAFYRDLIGAFGVETGPLEPRLAPAAADRQRAQDLLRRLGVNESERVVGIAPGAAYGHAKRWLPRRFAEVVTELTRASGIRCLLVGSTADRGTGRDVMGLLPDESAAGVIDLIGRTDLALLIGVVSCCSAFVSNDSGAMHLAAALGLPVAAVFGPTDERATGPLPHPESRFTHDVLTRPVWCRPCMLRECPIDHRCMSGIPASVVVEAVRARLM